MWDSRKRGEDMLGTEGVNNQEAKIVVEVAPGKNRSKSNRGGGSGGGAMAAARMLGRIMLT